MARRGHAPTAERGPGRTGRQVGRWLLVAGFLLAASPAGAMVVRLAFPADPKPKEVALVVVAKDGTEAPPHAVSAAERKARRIEVETPEPGSVLTCRGPAAWCPRVEIAKPVPPGLELAVWPGGDATLTVAGGPGVAAPATVAVEGSPVAGAAPTASQSVVVPEGGAVRLRLPAAALDLRFAADGRVPVYRRGVTVAVGKTLELGALRFLPGASMVGTVVDDDTAAPIGDATISVVSAGSEGLPPSFTGPHDAGSSTSGERGFFQVGGLPAGRYDVELAAEGYAPRTFGPFEARPDEEVALGTLEVTPYLALDVTVTPPLDPRNRRWRVRARPTTGGRDARRTSVVETDEAGRGTLDRIAPGDYEVTVESAAGEPLLVRQETFTASVPLDLAVDLVAVEGTVTLGGDPFPSRVRLSSGDLDSIALETDEKGVFAGLMRTPHLEVLYADVRGRHEAIRRIVRLEAPEPVHGVLHLDIRLGAATIEGVVVDASGEPAPQAIVDMGGLVAGFESLFQQVGDDGRFRFGGLDAGTYEVIAHDEEHGDSAPVDVALAKDGEREVTLVLGQSEEVAGTLSDASGAPVAGATIDLSAISSSGGAGGDRGRTGPSGRFSARLPKGAERIAAIVFAPGHMLWSGCVLRRAEEPLAITLPAGPAGTLVLEPQAATSGSSAGSLLLVSGDGGGIPLRELVKWLVDETGRLPDTSAWGPGDRLTLPAVAPGVYAPLTVARTGTGVDLLLGAELCLGGLANADWHQLAPGGTLELEVPLANPRRNGSYPIIDH